MLDNDDYKRVIQCVNACAGMPDPVRQMNQMNERERLWETTMMELVGEDGPGSVREVVIRMKDIIQQAKTVRAMQKRYFKSRAYKALVDSKMAETTLDNMLNDFLK